jgi:hypothetical protein
MPEGPAPRTLAHLDLHADGLLLRPWRPEDAPRLVAIVTDPLIARWNPDRGLDREPEGMDGPRHLGRL